MRASVKYFSSFLPPSNVRVETFKLYNQNGLIGFSNVLIHLLTKWLSQRTWVIYFHMVASANPRLPRTADSSNILAVCKTLVATFSFTTHATVILVKVFLQIEHLIGPHLEFVPQVSDKGL